MYPTIENFCCDEGIANNSKKICYGNLGLKWIFQHASKAYQKSKKKSDIIYKKPTCNLSKSA